MSLQILPKILKILYNELNFNVSQLRFDLLRFVQCILIRIGTYLGVKPRNKKFLAKKKLYTARFQLENWSDPARLCSAQNLFLLGSVQLGKFQLELITKSDKVLLSDLYTVPYVIDRSSLEKWRFSLKWDLGVIP